MTDRLFRLDRRLPVHGQARGLMLMQWGLVAFCVVSPISIAATNMAWVAGLLGLLHHAVVNRDLRAKGLVQRTDLDAPLLCFVLASLLSVFLSLDVVASVVEFRSVGLMVIFYLFAWGARAADQRKTLVRILLIFSCVSALYGWIQFVTGWDLLGHYRPETRKVCGFFGLHLTYGEHLSMVICLGTGTLLWGDRKGMGRLGDVLLLGLMASAVLLSGAKGAWLSLMVGLGVVFALRGSRTLAMYAMVGILVCVAVDILMAHRLWGNLVALLQIDTEQKIGPAASNTHRLCMWWTGLWISLEHFLYGVGLHAVEQIYPAFRHPLAIEPNQWHLHSNFVHLGVTRGMLGLAAFLYIFLRVFRLGFRGVRASGVAYDRGLAAGVLGASAAFLVTGLTEYSWGDSEVLMLLYALLGLLAACTGEVPDAADPQQALHESAPTVGGAAWERIRRRSRDAFFSLVITGLCCLAFLFPVAPRSVCLSLWEGLLGLFLLLLAIRGWGLRGDVPVWQRQVCGGLALCVGFHFTEAKWVGKGWMDAPEGLASAALVGLGALSVWGCVLLSAYLRRRTSALLVDLSGIGALWIWALLALVTHGLLRMASWTDPLWGPPYLPVLVLAPLCAALYSALRFTYRGGRVQRALLVVLGLCTIAHLFR